MKTYSEALSDLLELEDKLGLYNYTVKGVPIYQIFRYRLRGRYLERETNEYKRMKNHSKFNFSLLLKTYLSSALQVLNLCCTKKRIDNVIFGFPRLENVNGIYLDKFVDPVILESNLKDSYIYFERGRSGVHLTPRLNEERIITTEFIDFTSHMIGALIAPIVLCCFLRTILEFYSKLKKNFKISDKMLVDISHRISILLIKSLFFKMLFKKMRTKRFFSVASNLFRDYTLACKKLGIPVYEFQHGITVGCTALYSGGYDQRIQPDYFLAFGESSMCDVFSVPLDRMIKIGWAFKSFVKQYAPESKYGDNTFLMISEPHISQKIIQIVIELSDAYPDLIFHIRLHPMEKWTSKQMDAILPYKNITIQDNTINSNIALLSYNSILGENSTVMYEALSLGKKVGRFYFNGFVPTHMPGIPEGAFYYIQNIPDFKNFLLWNSKVENLSSVIYSDFESSVFNSLLI